MFIIVDSGGANIASILFAFERLKVAVQLSRDSAQIRKASHVILPGVGAAGTAMAHLQNYQLISLIKSLTQPVLGICLGMQLLFAFSEENQTPCLNIINERIIKIPNQAKLSIPHMGWNSLHWQKSHPLLASLPDNPRVYFVHSYMALNNNFTVATTHYGATISAIVQHKNFYGMQFHPERSGLIGQQLLKNFLEL